MKNKTFIILLMIACLGLATTVSARSLIGKEDLHMWDGVSGDTSYTRTSSGGYSLTLHDITWVGVDVLHEYGASVNQNDTTLSAALTAVGTSHNVAFWMAPGDWDITAGVTVPDNVALIVPMGTQFKITSGVSLVVQGPYITGEYQTITGGGNIVGLHYLSPMMFGAIGDGSTDDAAALQKCFDATATDADESTFSCLTPNYNSIIDLKGKTYLTNTAIEFPSGGGIKVKDGTLLAGASLPSGDYLIEFGHGSAFTSAAGGYSQLHKNSNITFDNVVFDNGSVAGTGGLYLIDFSQIKVTNCTFRRFKAYALMTALGNPSQELIVDHTNFAEYEFYEAGYNTDSNRTGTAMYIETSDNSFDQVTVARTRRAMNIKANSQQITNCHFWGTNGTDPTFSTPATDMGGVHLEHKTAGASPTHIYFTNVYFDHCYVSIINPAGIVKFAHCTFYTSSSGVDLKLMMLTPKVASLTAKVDINHCYFRAENSGVSAESVYVYESGGTTFTDVTGFTHENTYYGTNLAHYNLAELSGASSVTLTGIINDLPVDEHNIFFVATATSGVTIIGMLGGQTGQVVRIMKTSTANCLWFGHNHAGATEYILTPSGTTEELATYGGRTFVYNGTFWLSAD